MRTVVMLFTRDLRVHDNPALAAACASAEHVVPLFVRDPAIPSNIDRDRFLAACLVDLRAALRRLGGDLVVRTGDPVAETIRMARAVGAEGIVVAADASRYASARARRLARECRRYRMSLRELPGVTVVPPGELRPTGGGGHYRVFTPYWRAWSAARWRPVHPVPSRVRLPGALDAGELAATGPVAGWVGGESAARQRMASWDGTGSSKLSPYLHFGCLSARELAGLVDDERYRRQLCWRDFHHQVLADFPELPVKPYRDVPERWRDDDKALAAWRDGRTGVPIVDAGMRQLAAEAWLPNRMRLITASYLTKVLGLDWRAGAQVYAERLIDADVANNYGNWQWVAGTGNDPRPGRGFNVHRQAERFDPDGSYVRRYVLR